MQMKAIEVEGIQTEVKQFLKWNGNSVAICKVQFVKLHCKDC